MAILAPALLLAGVAAADPGSSGPDAARGAGRLWLGPGDAPGASAGALHQRQRRNVVNAVKLGLAGAGTGLLAWGAWLRRRGRAAHARRLRDGLLAALGAAGLLGWWNFGLFHYPAYPHPHELFHYVLGAKYFPELGYQRLYRCVALADAEAGLVDRVERRRITDLETYRLEPAAAVLAAPGACRDAFSEERWRRFSADVGWFRERMPPEQWETAQRDHGYNPSPAWGVLGRALVGDAPVDERRLATLLLIDPMLELLMLCLIGWTFGWRAGCVATLYWGTNHPAEFGWVGGSYLREGWLVASVAGICLLRRGVHGGAGFCLGLAALLRVFPALFLLPLVLEAAWRRVGSRRPTPAPGHRQLVGGALAAALVALPLSLATGGGEAWSAFGANMALHASSTSSNAVGLKTLLSADPSARERRLAEGGAGEDLARSWRVARHERFRSRWPLFALLAAGFVALSVAAARRHEDWVGVVLGIGLVPVLLEPSSYYTSAFLAYGLLWTRRESIGVALCALSAAGWVMAALWLHWDDVFVATSAVILAFVAFAPAVLLTRGEGAVD